MDYYQLLAYGIAVAVVFTVIRLLFRPLKFAFFVLYYAVVGGLIIWGINTVGAFVGLHLPLNPVAAFLSGYLGIPGILLVYALQKMLA